MKPQRCREGEYGSTEDVDINWVLGVIRQRKGMRMEDDAGNRNYTCKGIDGTNARVSVSESIKNFPKSDCYVVGVFQTTLPRKFWARMFTNS